MVDLIIVNFNTKDLTSEFIKSIMNHTHIPYDLYVVDNGSVDGSVEFIKDNFPHVKVIEMKENSGYAKACNAGARAGSNEFIMFLNSDMLALPNWINPLISVMESDNSIAVVGPKLVNEKGQIVGAGVVGTNQSPVIRGWLTPDQPNLYFSDLECLSVCGAAYMIRRSNIPILGLFDERYPFYFEETDYSYNVRDKGYKVVYVAKSKMIHYHQKSPSQSQQRNQWFREGDYLFNQKWGHMMGDATCYV